MHPFRCVLLMVAMVPAAALAQQSWPVRPVRLIVPFTPGGGSDVAARAIAYKLAETWGQQVVVDNRPGAATLLGTDLAAKAPADGYTLLMASASYAINPHLVKRMPYRTLQDHTPITQVAQQPYLLVIHPALAAHNVREFLALARARPGTLNYGSPGAGSGGHLATAYFCLVTQTQMTHVPYRGGAPALTDLIAGQIQFMFPTMLAAAPHVRGARLRSLGVSSARRAQLLPDIPTIAEAGVPGFEAASWNGLMAPAGVAPALITRIHHDAVLALQSPAVRDKLAADGAEAVGNTPQEFAAHIRSELEKWARVIKAAGLEAM